MKKRNRFNLLRGEHGASLVELALLLPLFVLLLFGAVDVGRAFYLSIELTGAAHTAAMYGAQNPTDTAGMKTAAQDDAPNVPNLSVGTPTYGCECATDTTGSTYSASCSATPTCSGNNVVYRVNVKVSATYTTLFPWHWAGMGSIPSSFSLSSSAAMRSGGS